MTAEDSTSRLSHLRLDVFDQLSEAEGVDAFLDTLRTVLSELVSPLRMELVTAADRGASKGDLADLARAALDRDEAIESGEDVALPCSDGQRTQLAIALEIGPGAKPLDVLQELAHVAGRLLPRIRTRVTLSAQRDRQAEVVHELQDLGRRTLTTGAHLALTIVDWSVTIQRDGSPDPGERQRVLKKVRQIVALRDQVWEWSDDQLLIVQTVKDPRSALDVDQIGAAVHAALRTDAHSSRIIDVWTVTSGPGLFDAEGMIEQASRGLLQLSRMRRAGRHLLRGDDPEQALALASDDPRMTLLVLDAEGAIRGLNSVAAATVSGTPDDFVNKQIDAPEWMYYHPDGTVMRGEDLPGTRAITTGVCVQDSLLGVRVGRGPMRWVLVTAAAVGDTKGAIIGAVVSFSDLTERRGPDEGLSNRLRGAIDLIRDPMVFLQAQRDRHGTITDFVVRNINNAALTLLGRSESEVVGHTESSLHPGNSRLGIVMDYAQVVTSGRGTKRMISTSGDPVHGAFEITVEPSGDDGVVVVAHNMSAASRPEAAGRLDPLTGLASRDALLTRLDLLTGHTDATLYMLDIDDFKSVHESLGRERSDQYLIEVGRLLEDCVDDETLVARMGADEYALLSNGDRDAHAVAERAERLRVRLKEGVAIGDTVLTAASAIGVAWSGAGIPVQDLLPIADAAMFEAKAAGGDCVSIGRAQRRPAALRAVQIESDLRAAVAEGQFLLRYQPVVDLQTGAVNDVEALIRWQHPVRGLVPPNDFISVAERRHLIGAIGLWVIDEACQQISRWEAELGWSPRVSVNVSTGQFVRNDLAAAIADLAARAGIDRRRLQLEVTESQVLNADDGTLAQLRSCLDAGSEMAIDDFGTGHAGFDYLRRIPASTLKIDKTFIDGVGSDPTDTAIVAGVITVGHGLNLRVVAEGVERTSQAQRLRELGCDAAQGWLWSPALHPDDVAARLKNASQFGRE